MSALSTPGGGGTTAQSKPTSGKQKFQKLDINSLYCASRNESSEPSSVKAQLSRKHGMQSLGKVPSARRPPANLPSLKTETGQDTTNTNSTSATTATTSTPATCTTQTTTTTTSSGATAGAGSNAAAGSSAGGWVSLPPPTSPHFRTEFPSLEAAAQPSHRDHSAAQPQLRPQTEGSWTCGGKSGIRPETSPSPGATAAAAAAASSAQQTPAFAMLPSFLMKGSSGGGLGLGTLSGPLREQRPAGRTGQRNAPAPTPRGIEVLTARPILRDEQISSLDEIGRDAGWAQHDVIDYDQKLTFSDGESSTPTSGGKGNKSNNKTTTETERLDSKIQEPGDEDQLWAERRRKQTDEVAQVVARARQRKEEEQRRQMRESLPSAAAPGKDSRDRNDRDNRPDRDRDRHEQRDRNDNREREQIEIREKERNENRDRERSDNWSHSNDNRDKERIDNRDIREKDLDNRERLDNRDRYDNRERDRVDRDRAEINRDRDRLDNRDRGRLDNRTRSRDSRDRLDSDKDRTERDRNDNRDRSDNRDRNDNRDRIDNRDRNDNRDRIDNRDRSDRDRFSERDRDRDRERERERDREFRERDYRDQANPAMFKTYQTNIPPRFLRQQQSRQQEEQNKGWAFTGKPAGRRPEPPPYNAPRHTQHNGRRSYSRDYSEDEFRRDEKGGQQWRSEMQDYDSTGREIDRQNSKESYKDYADYKDRNSESDRKSVDSVVEHINRTTAAEKLTEVFERKSIGLVEPFSLDSSAHGSERRHTPPSNVSHRESVERDYSQASWAEVSQEPHDKDQSNYAFKSSQDKSSLDVKEGQTVNERNSKETIRSDNDETKRSIIQNPIISQPPRLTTPPHNLTNMGSQSQNLKLQTTQTGSGQAFIHNQQVPSNMMQSQAVNNSQNQTSFPDVGSKPINQNFNKLEPNLSSNLSLSQFSSEQTSHQISNKPCFITQKSERELSESESIASKSSTDPSAIPGNKSNEVQLSESLHNDYDTQKHLSMSTDEKLTDRFSNENLNKIQNKEPIEHKSSGSGSEKKGRGYGYGVCVRVWGSRESRGRRSHRSSRSKNRASESDGSIDGAPNSERRERRRAPRSPRGPKKDKVEDAVGSSPVSTEQHVPSTDCIENREPFAPRGQPSRRGRGGFQGTSRPPAPAKRVAGYGPPNTKSPFGQANRAVKDNEENQGNEDKQTKSGKQRTGSQSRRAEGSRGRDRRPKATGPPSGEDENWETTSEHSEGGGHGGQRRARGRQSGHSRSRNQNSIGRQNNSRNNQNIKKESSGIAEVTDGISDLKIKKDDDIPDDGFQEVRNKKTQKDLRGPPSKEETKQQRSHSNQGSGRNGSTSRNGNEKPLNSGRGSVPVSSKSSSQYDRPRQPNLAPRFVKQRQKQQLGLVSGFGSDTGAVPPPPPINAWDKPISQTLRANIEENNEIVETKSGNSSQRSSPGDSHAEKSQVSCSLGIDKSSVLDGTTPLVETIIFENTNYKTAPPPAEALKQKYQPSANTAKSQGEETPNEMDARSLSFNGDVRAPPKSIQELISENGRNSNDGEGSLGLQISFDSTQKGEDSSDMKLDFAFDSDLGQLTEDKSAKTLGLPRATHGISVSSTISPLAADLNLKIASVKKVWEMPAVAEGGEELQFAGFEETNTETGAPPNVCKVKPTQQLQSPPPQHYNHVGYQGGYGGLSVPSPPAVVFNSSQQLLGSSQQLPQQGGLYGAFLDQSRGQFGGFPGAPYGAASAAPYNYQPPPDMFQSLPSQYRMAAAAAGGGAAFGQSGQLGNNPSTVLISSTSNSLMSANVKQPTQQIGAIGSKGGGVGNVGGVGGVGGVNTYQAQQYLGYSGPVGDSPYSLTGLLPRAAPPGNSYYTPYQPQAAPAPTYPLQYTQPAQSQFGSQFLPSSLQVAAAAVQQMQYRAPMQQQYAPPAPRPPPQQLKSPLHEHANGFAQLCEAASPTPKSGGMGKPQKAPHSPPQHKYQHVSHPHPHHAHHQQHQQQMVGVGGNGRPGGGVGGVGGSGGMQRAPPAAPRYPSPIQRPMAPGPPVPQPAQQPPAAGPPVSLYRTAPPPRAPHVQHAQPQPQLQPPVRHQPYYQTQQRNGASSGVAAANTGGNAVTSIERPVGVEAAGAESVPGERPVDEPAEERAAPPADAPTAEAKSE